MVTKADILWFRTTFGPAVAAATADSVFDADMLTALACLETGEMWSQMRRNPALSPERIAALCCGDMIGGDAGRRAFPRTAEALRAAPQGETMFAIARQALLAMAAHVRGYGAARTRPDTFAHGFGLFQYDLQFFRDEPAYFLERRYERFEASLGRALAELRRALETLGLAGRHVLTDLEFCHVAIIYNTGRFLPAKGLRQGYRTSGLFYGEAIRDHLRLARSVTAEHGLVVTGEDMIVATQGAPLRLRAAPEAGSPEDANVLAGLANGQRVRAVAPGDAAAPFRAVEAMVGGEVLRGYAATRFLRSATGA